MSEISESPLAGEFVVREQEAAVALIVDLIERMEKAYDVLQDMAGVEPDRAEHLESKAQGVLLCLSYAREGLRVQA